MVKNWIKDNLFEVTLFMLISAVATPAYFFNDNNLASQAVINHSFDQCNKVSTQFIKQRCYKNVWESYKDYCPDIALNGNVKGCMATMKARMKALRPAAKFPLKLMLYLVIEFVLGLYFFYLKARWRSS